LGASTIYSVTKDVNVIFSVQVKSTDPAERGDHALCAAQSSATLCRRMMHTFLAPYMLIVLEKLETVQKKA